MIFRSTGRFGAAVAALIVMMGPEGCAVSSVASNEASDVTNAGGTGGSASNPPVPIKGMPVITFDPAKVTTTVLGRASIGVIVSPARGQTVALALTGDSLDASLDVSEVVVDADGKAMVTLIAPSTPTTFSIRASIDRSASAELPVAVEQAATGTIAITGTYSGRREVTSYRVRVLPNQDCSTAASDASATTTLSITASELPVDVANVPLATPFAVVVEGDRTTVRGCSSSRGIATGATTAIAVPLDDLPMNLDGVSVDVALTTVEGLTAFQENLRASVPAMITAFVLGAHDLVELLDAMQSTATGSLQQEFVSLRTASDWDSMVVAAYDSVSGVDRLRRQLRTWLFQGIDRFSAQPSFAFRLDLSPSDYTTPKLQAIRVAGIDAVARLSMRSSDLAYHVEAGDRLSWSSTLDLSRAVLIDALALEAAVVTLGAADSIPVQLARYLDCDAFALQLDQNAVFANASSHVCKAACLATLCRSALDYMYQRATVAAFGEPTTPLQINASGIATVDVNGRPSAITGKWIGVFGNSTNPSTLAGTYLTPAAN